MTQQDIVKEMLTAKPVDVVGLEQTTWGLESTLNNLMSYPMSEVKSVFSAMGTDAVLIDFLEKYLGE